MSEDSGEEKSATTAATATTEELQPLKTISFGSTPTTTTNNNAKDNLAKEESRHSDIKSCEDFEEILSLIGDEGKYQKILLYGVLCPSVVALPFFILNTVFLWDIPDHWCHVPGRNQSTTTLEEWKNLTVPWEVGPDGQMRYSQCKMFDPDDEENITECRNGWEYDDTDYSSTVPSEFDWVCDKDYYATDCFTWSNMGYAIGSIVFGIMADKYGRRPAFFLSCFCNSFFKIISLFVPQHYFLYKLLQLLGSLVYPTVFTMPALISAEVSSPEYRSWIYAVTWMIWVLGNALIPFVAMVCRGWFLFGCITAVPGVLLFLYLPVLDESPRWMITVGKSKEAIKIIQKIADTNGKDVHPEKIELMVQQLAKKQQEDTAVQNVSVWSLFSRFNLAKNTIMLITAWTMNMLLYYGVTLNTTKMAGNKFINYFVLAVIEVPAGWIAGKMVERTGRRWTQTGFFVMCVIGCAVCAIAVGFPNSTLIVVISALVIKFGVTVTSMVVYLQGAEIFPTLLRSTGSGLASTVSSVVGTVGPYIVYTGTIHVSFPYALMCIISLIGTVSASYLPETLKQNLPETVEDADKFGRSHKYWSYLPKSNENEEEPSEKVVRRKSSEKDKS